MTDVPSHLSSALREPGEHAVDVPIMCSITRFKVSSAHALAASYLDYRRVLRAAREAQPPGLLQSAFLVESPMTWYSFSIWSGIPKFSAYVPSHVVAARRSFSRLAFDAARGPELWSTKWRLASVTNNLNWDGFDLRGTILEESRD
jgi:hypothetical protein